MKHKLLWFILKNAELNHAHNIKTESITFEIKQRRKDKEVDTMLSKNKLSNRSATDRRSPVDRRILNLGPKHPYSEERKKERRSQWEKRSDWKLLSKWSSSPFQFWISKIILPEFKMNQAAEEIEKGNFVGR